MNTNWLSALVCVLTCLAADEDKRPVADVCGHSTGLDMGIMSEFNVSLALGDEPRLIEERNALLVHIHRRSCGTFSTRTRTEPQIGTEDSAYGLVWLYYTPRDCTGVFAHSCVVQDYRSTQLFIRPRGNVSRTE
jgi:hypothetical protein